MKNSKMDVSDLEIIYDSLAESLDKAEEENQSLYLTKLVLILSAKLNNKNLILEAMDEALKDL